MKRILNSFLFLFFCTAILVLSVRGIAGNPHSFIINRPEWKDEGPLELSPERGRFALVLSMIEDASFTFSLPIARFVTPDLGYSNGKYVSLFPPGVSVLAIPGYLLGRTFGIAQVGTFAVIALFALCNALLIVAIARRLGAPRIAAYLGALTFLFATPAFAYAVSFYQHHISTFLILSALFILLRTMSLLPLTVIWFLAACSLPIDYPNFFLFFPLGVAAAQRIFSVKKEEGDVHIIFRPIGIFTILTICIPLFFFAWFNTSSYGNPFQLAGTVSTVKAIDEFGKPTTPDSLGTEGTSYLLNPEEQRKSAVKFFQTRNMLNGFYIHVMSPDRGILMYTPVLLLGCIGLAVLYKKKPSVCALFSGVLLANILLYSMWGDPWGGWAFGSRYLIPGYAILSICIACALSWTRSMVIPILFFVLFSYSVVVNTMGALTSNRNPPQVEVLSLEALSGREEKYTYLRNLDLLRENKSKSFVYQTYIAPFMPAWQYYLSLVISIVAVGTYFLCYFLLFERRKEHV